MFNKTLKAVLTKTANVATRLLEADQMSLADKVGQAVYDTVMNDQGIQALISMAAQKMGSSALLLAPVVGPDLTVSVWKLIVAKSETVVAEAPTFSEIEALLLPAALGKADPAFVARLKSAQ